MPVSADYAHDHAPHVRVVHVADYGNAFTGSFVPMLRAAIGSARDRGWEAEIVLGGDAHERGWIDELQADGIPVRFLPRARASAAGRLAEMLRDFDGVVILHSHFSRFDVPCVLAAGRRSGPTAIVWHEHSELSRRPWTLLRNSTRFATLGRRVGAILAVAPQIERQLVHRGAPPGKVVLLPNPVDPARFPVVTPSERSLARATVGIAEDAEVVLHFGWDWRRKGGDLLLEAVAKLRAEGRPGLVAVLVGDRARAERHAAALGIEDSVLIAEPREHHELFYAAADVFVSCGRREGTPFAAAEALCRGIGLVLTDLPGQRALGAGLAARRLVPIDANEIAEGIRGLLERSPEARELDSQAANAWVRDHLEPARWSARLMSIYDELVDAPAPEAGASRRAESPAT
jgi:glycosyltransferase involved in cell wall biosynthesis